MSELSDEERERQENWRALQLALGLSPEEAPAPAGPMAVEPKPEKPKVAEARVAEPTPLREAELRPPVEKEEIHLFGEGIITEEPVVESAAEFEEGQEVEVGEAPEEVPEEPAPSDEKRRRRRRRRRGRRGGAEADSGPTELAGAEAAEEGGNEPLFDTGAELAPTAGGDELEEEEIEGAEEEDEVEVEPISFADWSVPTWNELIGSLYRPER